MFNSNRWACILAIAILVQPLHAEEAARVDEPAQPIWQGETQLVQFSVDEGTWLNLTLSPDGKTLAFDMLGDLYTLPVEGGNATRLTTTRAQEVQPQFSPDGRELAYISDVGGGHNLMIMNLETGEERALTKETFRLITNPRWHPDGSGLVARKHFTGTRSLGSGEMWFYHRDGGSGVQLTEKRNDQQDENDPVYSPDGRFLFYTQDATPGPYFQYNKNPHEGIYLTRRLNLESGEDIALLGGPGGAVRPEPSPDGRFIAYVKRVQTQSVLMLYDRKTGSNRPLYDGLDHDQQEVWALFGLYPNFAWTPDSSAIYFWAKGGIYRLDIATRSLAEVPFVAEVEIEVAKTKKAEPQVGEPEFRAHMLRDWATSPDGKYALFHALGSLYSVALSGGEPKRLTALDGFEYSPSFSPDGRYVVFAHWSDEDYGSLYRARWQGRKGVGRLEKITAEPGHYQNPSVNDRGAVAYEKQTGNGFRGYLHGLEPGLYVFDPDTGATRRIQREGRNPQWLGEQSRIAFETGGGDKKKIVSIDHFGSDRREHFNLGRVSEWRIDSRGERIAFREDFKVFVAPVVRSARVQELSRKVGSVTVEAASEEAGRYLHWSADSLHWGLGSRYFSWNPADEAPQSVDIDFKVEVQRSDRLLAYTNARFITMAGDSLENGVMLVRGNLIEAIGAVEAVAIPDDAEVIDLQGNTVSPGFIDTHAHHTGHFYSSPLPQTNASYLANLAFGVTTTHDPSTNTETVFSLAELQRRGDLIAPRIFSTGAVLYGAKSNSFVDIESLDDARMHLKRLRDQGAFSVKSYNQPRRDQRQFIFQAAAELGMSVYPEGGATFYNQLTHIIDGASGLEHNLPVAPLYEDVLSLWGAVPEVGYTQTLVVNYAGLNSEYYWYQHMPVWQHALLGKYTSQAELTARSRRVEQAADDDYFFQEVAASGKALQDRGVLVTVGAHGQLQGLGYHWEMWSMAMGGMSPGDVLRAATIDGARYLNMDSRLGSLEAGKLADFVVLEKNPLDDIRNTDSVRLVSVDGRLYDVATMNQIAPIERSRGKLWFEREGQNTLWNAENWGMTRPEDELPRCPAHTDPHF